MKHACEFSEGNVDVSYEWKKGRWHSLRLNAKNNPIEILDGSEEEFITEHFWGYTKLNDRSSSEYQVEYPRWKVYPVQNYKVDVDFGVVYGEQFDFLRMQNPLSVFLAEGSPIVVRSGRKI